NLVFSTPQVILQIVSPEKSDIYQLFYDTGKNFNETESVIQMVDKGDGIKDVIFGLPVSLGQVKSIRIDPGSQPTLIKIKSIKLTSDGKEYHWNATEILQNFRPAMYIDNFSEKEGLLYISSTGTDPVFISTFDFNIFSRSLKDLTIVEGLLSLMVAAGVAIIILFSRNWNFTRLVASTSSFFANRLTHLVTLAIIVSIILGSAIRLYKIDQQSLWSDELRSVGIATLVGKENNTFENKHMFEVDERDSFWTHEATEPHPPLYDYLLKQWTSYFGASDLSVRLPSAIFGIVLLLWTFLALRKIIPPETQFYYVFLLSFSFGLVEYSQEARNYMLSCLLSGILMVEFTKDFLYYTQHGKYQALSITTLSVIVLLSYSHYFGIPLVVIFGLIYGINFIKNKQFLEILKLFLAICCILPWLYLAKMSWLLSVAPRDFSVIAFYFQLWSTMMEFLFPKFGILVIVFLTFVLWANSHNLNQCYAEDKTDGLSRSLHRLALLNITIALLFILILSVILKNSPVFNQRYLIFIFPNMMFFLAVLITCIKVKPFLKIPFLLGSVALSLSMSLKDYYLPHKEQYREASRFIADNYTNQDLIVSTWSPNRLYYLHYLRQFLGKQVGNRLLSVNDPTQAVQFCVNQSPNLSPGNKIFTFYHGTHAGVITPLTMLPSCQKYLKLREERDFWGIGVKVFEKVTISQGATSDDPVKQLKYIMFHSYPYQEISAYPVKETSENGQSVLMVHAPGELRFAVKSGRHLLTCEFGILSDAYPQTNMPTTDGVEFSASLLENGQETTLFKRFLNPVQVATDRGIQPCGELAFEVKTQGDLVLRTHPGPANNRNYDWSFWTAVQIGEK
ncbi:MAG: hypothetical protein BWK78_08645, partial [Thiotrichaceae bacterium IS1]